MEKKYYHITENKKSIINSIIINGLKGNKENEIFLFENKTIAFMGVVNQVADCIAFNQVFLKEYSLFEINGEGIKPELKKDNCGEISSLYQWIATQQIIEPKYIKLLGVFQTKYNELNYEF